MRKLKNSFLRGLLGTFVLTVLLHLSWFSPFSRLFFGDWTVWPQGVVVRIDQVFRMWLTNDGFGSANIQSSFVTFKYLWMVLVKLGLNSYNAIKLVNFVPIALLVFSSPYIYFYHKTRSSLIAFVTSIFYGSTTYIILRSQGGHTLIALIYSVTPLFFYFIDQLYNKNTLARWLSFSLFYTILIGYEIRLTLILTVMAIAYIVVNKYTKMLKSVNFLVFGFLTILLNIYWILPVVFSNTGEAIAKTANRGLFGNPLFSKWNAITTSESAWTGGYPDNFFDPQDIKPYLYIIPLIVGALICITIWQKKITRLFVFFTLLSLVGIVLTKQSDTPFPDLYAWLYFHLPGFNLFREASKFYLLICFGYAGIIALGLHNISQIELKNFRFATKGLSYIVMILILIVSILNNIPVITGSIGGLYTSRPVIGDYTILNKKLASESEFSRVWWLPSYTSYGYFSDIHPSISTASILEKYNIENREFIESVKELVKEQTLPQFLRDTAIKYIVVPVEEPDRDGSPFVYYGGQTDANIRDKYIDILNKLPFVKENTSLGLKNIKLFEVEGSVASSHYLPVKNLYQIDSKNKNAFDFANNYFKNDIKLLEKNSKIPSSISEIQSLIPTSELKTFSSSDGFVKKITTDKPTRLISQVTPNIYAQVTKGTIIITEEYDSEYIINGETKQLNSSRVIETEQVDADGNYFVKFDDKFVEVLQESKTFVGSPKSNKFTYSLFQSDAPVLNDGFENGLWNEVVGDCANYDNSPDISQELKDDDLGKYLNLRSKKHIACTSKTLEIKKEGQYILSYSSKSLDSNTQKNGVYFGKRNDDDYYFKQNGNASNFWKRETLPLYIEKTGSFDIFLYAYEPQSDKPSTVGYDNISIKQIEEIKKFDYASDNFVQFLENNVKYGDTLQINKKNIINRSFEDTFNGGLWNEKLGDCLNYDDKPDISQRINTENNNFNLELRARRHFACTSKELTLSAINRKVNVSFRARSNNTADVRTYIENDDLSKVYNFKQTPNQWFYQEINVEPVSDSIGLAFYATENNGNEVITNFDDVIVTDYDPIVESFFLVEQSDSYIKPTLKEEYVNTTDRKVTGTDISKDTAIFANENYNSSWVIDNLKPDQYKLYKTVDGFMVFVIDAGSNIDNIHFVYKPQKLMDIGLWITGVTWLIILAYLVYNWRKPKPKSGSKTKLLALDNIALDLPVSYRSIVVIDPPAAKKRYMGL